MLNRYIKNALFFFITTFLLGVAACKKDAFLNVPPKGSLTNTITFSSANNADLFLNDIYENLPDVNNEDEILDQYTDNNDVGATWMTGQSVVRSNSINPSNVPRGPASSFLWSASTPGSAPLGNYDKIRKCNIFLQQAALNVANFDPAWYKLRVAEVHFLRAFFYSILYTNYGGVPLISTPLNNTSGDSIFIPRSTADQTLAYIEADCDSAASALPTVAGQSGRATQGAAMTLKGWVELFAASPLSNPGNDISRWATAAATNQQVMTLGVYSLFTGPDSTGYHQQFLAANNWNSETIFARGYATPSNGHKKEGILGPVIIFGTEQAWGNLAPTQNLVDDYEMDNGLPITDPASGYDPQHPYTGRELRFYESIVYDSSEWQADTWYSRIGGNNQIDLGSTSDISNTGYNGKKTLDESINGQTSLGISPGTSNYIFYRYAEVLLSYAEAQNEAVGPDASVYNAVNLVRTRSHLPALPAGLTQDQMRTDIRRERRIELAFEDKRWYDIRRWDITSGASGVLNSPEYGMVITPQPGGSLVYAKTQVFANKFSEYMNWLPIPQYAIDQNKNLVQNPGY
jgi:starch-binding outer membrane protein, SusD/RagB family